MSIIFKKVHKILLPDKNSVPLMLCLWPGGWDLSPSHSPSGLITKGWTYFISPLKMLFMSFYVTAVLLALEITELWGLCSRVWLLWVFFVFFLGFDNFLSCPSVTQTRLKRPVTHSCLDLCWWSSMYLSLWFFSSSTLSLFGFSTGVGMFRFIYWMFKILSYLVLYHQFLTEYNICIRLWCLSFSHSFIFYFFP